MKRTGHYIGITGVTKLVQMAVLGHAFRGALSSFDGPASELKFMTGVLVSSKTLTGGTNKYPNRYLPVSLIPEIFSLGPELPQLLQTVHYNTDDAVTIDEQIDEVVRVSGPNLHALQLNMRWAHPVKLQRVRRAYPDLRIILQIGTNALADVTETGDIFLGEALRAYQGVIDDFLIDPSGGTGKEIDVWVALACLTDRDIPPGILPGAAGGFDSLTVRKMRGVMRRLGPVNLDAEGKLRTSKEEGDYLSIERGIDYLNLGIPLMATAINNKH